MLTRGKNTPLNHYNKTSLMGWAVYFPDHYPFTKEARKKFIAVLLTTQLGVTYNTALKYLDGPDVPPEPAGFELINHSKEYCNKVIDNLVRQKAILEPSDNLQGELIRNCIGRLDASLEASIFLSYDGFNLETKSILRLILENINFVYQVSQVKDSKEGYIGDFCTKHNISTTSFSALKKYCKKVDIGRLYGILSNYSHFDPAIQNTMFTWGQGIANIYLKAQNYIYENFLVLIILLELLEDICSLIYGDLLRPLEFNENFMTQDNLLHTRYIKSGELMQNISLQPHDNNIPLQSILTIFR